MNKFKNFLNNVIERKNVYIFLISTLSFLLILLNLIDFYEFSGIADLFILNFLFQNLVILSTVFVILFIPFYPVFFIFFKEKKLNTAEKLTLTILVNYSFYIIIGYIGQFLGLIINGFYFFIIEFIIYFAIIAMIIIVDLKDQRYNFLKNTPKFEASQLLIKNDSIFKLIKQKIPLNFILLIVFMILICTLNIVRFDIFGGTDPWLHIVIIKMITEGNYLPIAVPNNAEYYGTVGLHLFGAIIHFYSNIDIILIPRYFVFYTIFLSGLVLYNLFMRIFRNKNLAILAIFVLQFALGFYKTMLQFWPAGITQIISLFIFYLLYKRFQGFIKEERPTNKIITSDMLFTYIIITVLYIGAILTHSFTIGIYIFSFIWLYFIYFIKDSRRGLDFLFLCLLGCIFIIFYLLGFGAERITYFFSFLEYLPLFIILGGCVIGSLFMGFIILRFSKSIEFTRGRFKQAIHGSLKVFEDKYFIPLFTVSITSLALLFYILNILFFKMDISNILLVFSDFSFILFGLWGFIIFQKKPKGKPIFIWLSFFGFLFGALFLIDYFTNSLSLWNRVYGLSHVIIIIGFIAYIYKLIKFGNIKELSKKLFILIIILYSLIGTFFHDLLNMQFFAIQPNEANLIENYSEYNNNRDVIFCQFGWSYVFIYYDYPYGDGNENLRAYQIHNFSASILDLYPPSNHFDENGNNILQRIKSENNNSDVFLIFRNQYIHYRDFEIFRYLSEDEIEEYYTLTYLNKVFSSRTENGEEIPLYWVI